MASPHQLFDDTSAGPGPHVSEYHNHGSPALGIPTQAFLSEPMSDFAMAYGSSLASQGKEMVDKNVSACYRVIPGLYSAISLLFDARKQLRKRFFPVLIRIVYNNFLMSCRLTE